jgi:3D-(3,5/4)-trihydroxycyclohexane-1,2-dione acylhydrolase (decyclizing)
MTESVRRQWELDTELRGALERAFAHRGLSVVHVPVYFGDDPRGGLGAYGQWNVGNWVATVEERYAAQDL